MRDLAETLGRKPPASRYSMDMSRSSIQGNEADAVNPLARKTRLFMFGGSDYRAK